MIEVQSIVEAQDNWRTAAYAGGDTATAAASRSLILLRKSATVVLENLMKLGYPPVPGILAVEHDLASRIRHLEAALDGIAPPSLVAFWRLVGGLSFVDVKSYAHVDFWTTLGIKGPDGYCDGVYVDSCSSEWIEFTTQDFGNREDRASWPSAQTHLLTLSPDGYHKDNISGGEPYGIELGGDWLAPLQNFSWNGLRRPASATTEPCDLLGYLRTAILECGGFPALLGVPSFEPIRERLLLNVEVF